MTSMFARPIDGFSTDIETITAAGIDVPPAILEYRERWLEVNQGHAGTARQRYIDAVVSGATDTDLTALRALALGEVSAPTDQAALTNEVGHRLYMAMVGAYEPHAATIYAQTAKLFDAAVAKLTKAITVVDVESPAELLVTADAKSRAAWSEAQIIRTEIDNTIPALKAAAALAGTPIDTPELIVSLIIDPRNAKRRAVWEAWDGTPGRIGVYANILSTGAALRAHPNPADLQPYRRPEPLREEWHATNRRGQYQRVIVDPEEINA